MQGVLGPSGPVVLITLPMRAPVLRLDVRSLLALEEWGQGLGLSTASHRARFRHAHPNGTLAEEIAHCLAAEGASDPMMFAQPSTILWASRRGQVMGHLPTPPDFDLLCGLWGEGQVTDPSDHDFADVTDLVRGWPAAMADAAAMARLVSASAWRCLDLRGPKGDPTPAICAELGALGFQIAHTGSARGVIFGPGQVPGGGTDRLLDAGFRRVRVLRFRRGWLEG